MYICGQKELLSDINTLIDKNKFPHFAILVGGVGFGKKLLADYIAMRLGANFVPCGIKAEEVRDVIYNSYTVVEKTLYMFFDCDDMSITSKNALLKVTEEPPNDSYFIMTVQDLSSVLGTIISRATVFYMNPYSVNVIDEYIKKNGFDFDDKTRSVVRQICTCPNDVRIASSSDIKAVYDTADKFIQYIGAVNLANELKISQSLDIKKDDNEKINTVMFMRCILLCCSQMISQDGVIPDDIKVFHSIIKETSKSLIEFQTKGSNKQSVIDNWIVNTHMAVSGGAF